jgi:hypothetical protein
VALRRSPIQRQKALLNAIFGIGGGPGNDPSEAIDGIAMAMVEDLEGRLITVRGAPEQFAVGHAHLLLP